MRPAGLLLFIGAVGFFNIYDGLISDNESEEANPGGSDRQHLMKLKKKFGVKERRSVQPRQQQQLHGEHLARSFDQFSEELLEHYRMPLRRLTQQPMDCRNSSPTSACSCLRLLCFGGSECTADGQPDSPRSRRQFARCRQTSMDGFLLCECKSYRLQL
ncbi:hypothetical protein BOX15_Mlig028234g1 [Macrostomum lignano]|uniref:Cocaine- and amphetamine-regulated transcript protein n=1 Tax=Macrostomum lignano TaxID=282301 RepID=A0A267GLL8_9PLAT|nr:hypothetical protein BOX15_Mlig028234g1 [Macrostomum lignano]